MTAPCHNRDGGGGERGEKANSDARMMAVRILGLRLVVQLLVGTV
jgi:hypothetical protein